MDSDTRTPDLGWCIVELLGHRKVVAFVRETTIAGVGMLRLDEPDTTDDDGSTYTPGRTQFVNPSSVYAIHPTTEDIATAMAAQWRVTPVTRWDLPESWRRPAITDQDGPF